MKFVTLPIQRAYSRIEMSFYYEIYGAQKQWAEKFDWRADKYCVPQLDCLKKYFRSV